MKLSTIFSISFGSSPPARGILSGGLPLGFLRRFIPACAGNTSIASLGMFQRPVHPRLRGEYTITGLRVVASSGSSPPARGIRPFLVDKLHHYRFIPACAGNTFPSIPRVPP